MNKFNSRNLAIRKSVNLEDKFWAIRFECYLFAQNIFQQRNSQIDMIVDLVRMVFNFVKLSFLFFLTNS